MIITAIVVPLSGFMWMTNSTALEKVSLFWPCYQGNQNFGN